MPPFAHPRLACLLATATALLLLACTSDATLRPEPTAPSDVTETAAPTSSPFSTSAAVTATPTPSPITPDATSWRIALAGSPALVDLVTGVLSGPEAVIDLTTTIDAYCSFHGELKGTCEARGLTGFDYFEAVVVSDNLHCEGCEVPPERIESSLSRLYRTGGVSIEQFWQGVDASVDPVASELGVQLVAAWVLDDSVRDLISERWQAMLNATHVLAFESTRPDPSDEAITGFLLFVDPSAPLPIAVIEPTSETWTAADTAQNLGRGRWQPLYIRR